ncbi:MAG: tetratricopeptide repeat protein [Pseudomonadota bacterium]
MDDYDLGDYGRTVTTASLEAQRLFDKGLVWMFGYNHEAAIICFERALEHDPGCAMARWGIAYAIGPNYNKPWVSFEPDEKPAALTRARAALAAVDDVAGLAPVERALLDALAHRYPDGPIAEDFGPCHDAFAAAMRDVHARFPADLDVAMVFAEALMNRTPWQLWDLPTGEPAAGADTLEARAVLEAAFATLPGAWDHPGLLHMYIHLMEMSPHPEVALLHGDRLHALVPDAGHLIHMATHIDVLCGDYQNVIARNSQGVIADRKFLEREGPDHFYSLYRCHNYHFKIYGAMFLGQPQPAMEAAEELIATLPETILRPLADWFEGFVPMKQHVLVRFGMWEAILAQDLPGDEDLYAVTTAMLRYARCVALSNTGDVAGAEAERDAFTAAFARVPESRMVFNNTCRDILQVAEQMLLGELEYRKGNHEAAFAHLRRSVELDDTLPYDEPWAWMQPTRHALGALLLEQGRYDEAEAVYRADLGLDRTLSRACQHPNNVWSLHGLHECLVHRGETAEALHVRQQLDRALARAHVPVRASCFCRGALAA